MAPTPTPNADPTWSESTDGGRDDRVPRVMYTRLWWRCAENVSRETFVRMPILAFAGGDRLHLANLPHTLTYAAKGGN